MKIFYVYILECKDKSFYVGVTSNLQKRIIEHNSGKYTASYTSQRTPVTLKWFEQFTDPASAFQVEKQIKGWSRRKKIALIEEDWEKLVKFSKNYSEYGKIMTLGMMSRTGGFDRLSLTFNLKAVSWWSFYQQRSHTELVEV